MIILPEDKEIMSYLSDEDAKLVLLAIFSEPDDEPELSVAARIAYSVVRNKSERISKKQSENGRKGGRPPKPTETQDNPSKPSVPDTVPDTVTDTVSVSDTEDIRESGAAAPQRARFKPPTVDEVAEYCRERKNSIDAQRWHDHYTANGWLVGKNKMKDWRAAVRTWEKNGYSNSPRGQPPSDSDNIFLEMAKERGAIP